MLIVVSAVLTTTVDQGERATTTTKVAWEAAALGTTTTKVAWEPIPTAGPVTTINLDFGQQSGNTGPAPCVVLRRDSLRPG